MPIHEVPGGFKWGNHGKVYPTRKLAAAQAAAAYANGYRGDAKPKPAKKAKKGRTTRK